MPRISRNLIIYLLILAAMVAVFYWIVGPSGGPERLTTYEMFQKLETGQWDVTLKGQTLTAVEKGQDEEFVTSVAAEFDPFEHFGDRATGADPAIAINIEETGGFSWVSLLINFLPIILIVGLFLFIFRQAQGGSNQAMSFGRSRARMVTGDKPTVTFSDVAGVDESKQELQEVVEFLKFPEKFISLGARIPRGVLLIGPPGTGKTLLARAVAGEAAVPFFSISGSEFVEMFVGVGASRVRDLFDQAKRNAPCIIFVDEIDAVGRHRGAGLGGGHDEREQTLNQILVEMDGFDSSVKVIVLAATNRPDILDPALLRPGRFDRRVVLDEPDINGRKAIMEVHARGKPLDEDVDFEVVAKQTPGFSGADLANLVNEAAILAARRDKKKIALAEFQESIDRVQLGPERRTRVISQKEKQIVAYHEAGHALVARLLPGSDPVHKISVVARGMAGGYTKQLPTEDRHFYSIVQLRDKITGALGGRAAEEIIFGPDEVTTGARSDLEVVTELARRMIKEYGMSAKLGLRTFGRREDMVFLGRVVDEQKDYGDTIADEIDQEIKVLIDEAYAEAKDVLAKNKDRLIHIAKRLITEETLEGDALETAFTEPISEDASEEAPAPQS